MKKPLSIVLAAAMLFSSFAASAAQTDVITSQANQTVYNVADVASTPDQPVVSSPDVPDPGDMVTYYFLAPDNYFKTDAGAVNEDVGYYYWAPSENASWPGAKMTPAPDVHPNAFKCTMPDSDTVAAMVFNAFVDAGNPQDPELAKAAHQTKDVYLDTDDYNNMIFVLDLENMSENPFSGALSAGGDWFALDAFKDSDNYKTYGFADEPTEGMATYYFLAPDNYFKTDAGAVNEDVGYYYWAPSENAPWPGAKMTPAPEVHPNAFKCTMPDSDTVAAMVFNAFVDAGNPQDPELAKAAHQTKDVYLDVDDYNNMIFVLNLDDMTENPLSGALSAGGDWFALDSFKDSDNYKTYGFAEEGMATYYFLAPDNYFKTEAGAVNEDVGYYYWAPSENAPWPGEKMTPAPEVHPNAFKCTMPDSDTVAAMVFNAFVDAGTPQDPELAKAAHQTKDVYLDVDDYNNMIFVLNLDDMTENPLSGALSAGGDWFALDAFENSYNYSTYSKTETPDEPVPGPATPDEPVEKAYKAGDTVTVDLMIGNVENLGAVTARINYNTEYLEIVSGLTTEDTGSDVPKILVNETTSGTITVGALYEAEKGTDKFAGEKAKLCTVTFKVLKDCSDSDMAISDYIVKIAKIDQTDKKIVLVVNQNDNAASYTALNTTVTSGQVEPKPDDPKTEKVKFGDVNKDGVIKSDDSLSILRASVNLEEVDIRIADIDGNGRIDSGDSLAVLRASVKLFDSSNEEVGTEIELPVA